MSRETYRRARARAHSGQPRARVYARVLAPEPLFCGLCGGYIDKRLPRTGPDVHPMSATVDHIRAIIDGGAELDPANLQPAHRRCNLAKEAARRKAHGLATRERGQLDDDEAWADRLLATSSPPAPIPRGFVDEDMP